MRVIGSGKNQRVDVFIFEHVFDVLEFPGSTTVIFRISRDPFSRFNRHKSQTAFISTLWLEASFETIKSRSPPRPPLPTWQSEMRSFAPRILPYESAVFASAEPPAIAAADFDKKVLRSIFCSEFVISPPRLIVDLAENVIYAS